MFTGYYRKPENATYLRSLGVDIPYGDDYDRRKVLPADLDACVITAWRGRDDRLHPPDVSEAPASVRDSAQPTAPMGSSSSLRPLYHKCCKR